MEFRAKQSELLKALQIVSKGVATKTTVPVLQNVCLSVCYDKSSPSGCVLKLSATNLEISIMTDINLTISPIVDGSITVPSRLLLDFVSNIDKEEIIAVKLNPEKLTIDISSKKFNATLHGISSEDFPQLPVVEDAEYLGDFGAPELKEALTQVMFAASSDESRPVLTGVLFKFSGGTKLELACADSFRLAVKTLTNTNYTKVDQSLIIPAKTLKELVSLLGMGDVKEDYIGMAVTKNRSQVIFTSQNFVFTSSLIEGNFPNYKQIIPESFTSRAVVSSLETSRALKVTSLFSHDDGNNIVRMSFKNDSDSETSSVVMSANNQVGDNRSEVVANLEGADLEIAANSNFLKGIIDAIGTSQTTIELQDASRPLVIKPVGKDDYVAVLMPMHFATR